MNEERDIMKNVLKWCKEMFPLLPSGLLVILIASVLITSQPEVPVVNAYTPEPIVITDSTASQETKAAKKKDKKKFETKELPEKTSSGRSDGGSQNSVPFTEGGTYKDGTYTGSAQGYGGTVGVKVTIKDGKITAIDVTQSSGETQSYFSKAKGVISKILKKQSPGVDVVSGATYSSKGIINAVKVALNKARTDGKEEETTKEEESKKEKETKKETQKETQPVTRPEYGFKDGSYTGTGEGFGGPIKVKVTIKKGKIKKIEILSAKYETPEYFKKAKKILSSIISAQSTDVDTISGATYSSDGILEAVYQALKKADQKPASDEKEKESKPAEETPEASEAETSPSESEEETESEGPRYKDGTWTGSAVCQNYNYTMTATVVIEEGVITRIEVSTDDGGNNEAYISYAVNGMTKRGKHIPGVPEQIIDKQSLDGIDAVSGATYSSKAVKEAVKKALEQALN